VIKQNYFLASTLFALILAAGGCAAHGQASVQEGGTITGQTTDEGRPKTLSGSQSGSISGSASGSVTHPDRD
jgi:hypothetical protein